MIITEHVEVKVNNNRINLYKEHGFKNIKQGDVLKIPVNLLSKNSRIKIRVKCDICGEEKMVTYYNYNKSLNHLGKYCCSQKCSMFKNIFTNQNKYGCDFSSKNDEIKEKTKKTLINKYGVDNLSKLDFVKNKKIITRNNNYPLNIKENFYQYRGAVRRLTLKNKKLLFDKWDGFDYYDKENIINNLNLKYYDNFYPTIDHKLSIWHGFNKKINPEIISDINNLCITKRKNNCIKGHQ